jgi:molybdate transport system permease protein
LRLFPLKLPNPKHFSNKLVLAALAVIIIVFVLFIALPILSVFLRLDLSQALGQLQTPEIVGAIVLGLLTSVVATVVSFVLAVPTAYVLATRQFRGKVVLDTLMDIPMVLPPAVAGVALLLAFAPKGLLGPVFNGFGLVFPGSTLAVILAQVFVASPLVLRSAKNAFENLNPDVINSAKILSGSKLRVFLTVTLPLCSHQILSGVMMTWARSMGEFGATLMFAGNLPGITQTMPLAIYLLMAQNPNSAIVLSALMIAFSFSILIGVKLLDHKRFGVKT